METEQYEPINPQPSDAEREAVESKDVEVRLTQQELDTLDELGPDNEAVQQWLTDNGITQHDRIVARVEGRDDAMVLDASAEDFLTRDSAASEAFNEAAIAEAARRTVVDIETAVDARSAELETQPRIAEEDIRDLGEEGLEGAGIGDPSEDEVAAERTTQELQSIEHTYQQQVLAMRDELAGDIARPLNELDSTSESISLGERTVLEGTEHALQNLEATLRAYDDYPLPALQTRLREAIDGLHGAAGIAGNYGEQTIGEAKRMLAAIDTAVNTQGEDAAHRDDDIKVVLAERGVDEVPFSTDVASTLIRETRETIGDLTAVRTDLEALDTGADTLKREITKAADMLQGILNQSYSRPVNSDEIQRIVQELKHSTSRSGTLAEHMRKAGGSLQATLGNVRRAYDALHG